jgi:MFS family permease
MRIPIKRTILWQQPDFIKLWTGQTISLLGSAITTLALPLTAISILHADAQQMGFLFALSQIPPLLFGLIVGAWVDRIHRRPLLILADLGRAILLVLIPLASILHLLHIEVLYTVSFLTATLSVIFTIASRSFLPSLVQNEHLIEGNSALQLSQSAAQIVGPNLAGTLIQLVTAPMAILGDSLSFILSVLFVWRIRGVEQPIQKHQQHLWREIGEGLRAVMNNPILRALAASNGTANIFWGAQLAILLLYMTRQLGINAIWLGIIYTSGNVGFLLGTLLAKRVVRYCGLGPALILTPLVSIIGAFLIPLAHGSLVAIIITLIIAQLLMVGPLIIYHIHEISLRQIITPNEMQGRINATMQVISWATTPVGALLGGWLGESIGLRPTLFIVAGGLILAQPWLLFSPLRGLRTLPTVTEKK